MVRLRNSIRSSAIVQLAPRPRMSAVVGGVDPRISGEQRGPGTTRCGNGRQEAASGQAASRLLRCAPALRVTRRNHLTHHVFMAGSELPATGGPTCENTSDKGVNPHMLCAPFIRTFSQPLTHESFLVIIPSYAWGSYDQPANAARRRAQTEELDPAHSPAFSSRNNVSAYMSPASRSISTRVRCRAPGHATSSAVLALTPWFIP